MSRSQDLRYPILAMFLDVSCLLLAFVISQATRNALGIGRELGETVAFPAPIVVATLALWGLVFFVLEVYNPERNTSFLFKELPKVTLATAACLMILAGLLYFTYRDVSRLMVVYLFVSFALLIFGWRIVYHLVLRARPREDSTKRWLAIVGTNELARRVSESIQQQDWDNIRFVGWIGDGRADDNPPQPLLGHIHEIRNLVEHYTIDELVIALPSTQYDAIQTLVQAIQDLPVHIYAVPDVFTFAVFRATVEDLAGIPLIHLRASALTPYQRFTKRVFDLILVAILLPCLWPLMLLIAAAIRLDSRGAAVFRQQRVGENRRIFTMYKFRTMVEHDSTNEPRFSPMGSHKSPDDPRITRLGRVLRRTSLDELPQLWNVLKGDMSFVGPRPEMPWFVDRYDAWQRQRFVVPQGITGWWQVNGRSNNPMHLHTEDDLYYIQNYSILFDIQILLRTVAAILRREGAF